MEHGRTHRRAWVTGLAVGGLITGALAVGLASGLGGPDQERIATALADPVEPPPSSWLEVASAPRPPSHVADPVEDSVYRSAAQAAWAYIQENRSPGTGLVRATPGWQNLTTWDLGSLLAGVHAAGELGLADRAEAEAWLRQILETIVGMPMYDDAAYNKTYVAATGRMVDRDGRPSSRGVGWSALDLGRLLIWLRIVADEHPSLAHTAEMAVRRIDFDRVVVDGTLTGEDLDRAGNPRTYPEGRLGYEQYAALGFALWDHPPERSLDIHAHADTVRVMGHAILVDRRGRNKLTSEPFILSGLEVGWNPPFRELARSVLAVQEARWRETGTITMVSEDAIERPPYYFYYYTVYDEGQPFVIRAQGPLRGDGPRWVSAKAAYAWHALMPGDYTWRAVEAVAPARTSRGWASGVFEANGRSTGVRNLNTAGIILEAALYRELGRPLLAAGDRAR